MRKGVKTSNFIWAFEIKIIYKLHKCVNYCDFGCGCRCRRDIMIINVFLIYNENVFYDVFLI